MTLEINIEDLNTDKLMNHLKDITDKRINKMIKHTPAPWRICTHADDSIGIWTPVYMSGTDRICAGVSSKANAYLIASAPELLEALEKAIQRIESSQMFISEELGEDTNEYQSQNITYMTDSIIELEKILTKAKGE